MATKDKAISASVIALQASALGLKLLGQTKASEGVKLLAAALQAGADVDAHMAEVAQKLADGASDDEWDDVMDRIHADSDELQAAKPTG